MAHRESTCGARKLSVNSFEVPTLQAAHLQAGPKHLTQNQNRSRARPAKRITASLDKTRKIRTYSTVFVIIFTLLEWPTYLRKLSSTTLILESRQDLFSKKSTMFKSRHR